MAQTSRNPVLQQAIDQSSGTSSRNPVLQQAIDNASGQVQQQAPRRNPVLQQAIDNTSPEAPQQTEIPPFLFAPEMSAGEGVAHAGLQAMSVFPGAERSSEALISPGGRSVGSVYSELRQAAEEAHLSKYGEGEINFSWSPEVNPLEVWQRIAQENPTVDAILKNTAQQGGDLNETVRALEQMAGAVVAQGEQAWREENPVKTRMAQALGLVPFSLGMGVAGGVGTVGGAALTKAGLGWATKAASKPLIKEGLKVAGGHYLTEGARVATGAREEPLTVKEGLVSGAAGMAGGALGRVMGLGASATSEAAPVLSKALSVAAEPVSFGTFSGVQRALSGGEAHDPHGFFSKVGLAGFVTDLLVAKGVHHAMPFGRIYEMPEFKAKMADPKTAPEFKEAAQKLYEASHQPGEEVLFHPPGETPEIRTATGTPTTAKGNVLLKSKEKGAPPEVARAEHVTPISRKGVTPEHAATKAEGAAVKRQSTGQATEAWSKESSARLSKMDEAIAAWKKTPTPETLEAAWKSVDRARKMVEQSGAAMTVSWEEINKMGKRVARASGDLLRRSFSRMKRAPADLEDAQKRRRSSRSLANAGRVWANGKEIPHHEWEDLRRKIDAKEITPARWEALSPWKHRISLPDGRELVARSTDAYGDFAILSREAGKRTPKREHKLEGGQELDKARLKQAVMYDIVTNKVPRMIDTMLDGLAPGHRVYSFLRRQLTEYDMHGPLAAMTERARQETLKEWYELKTAEHDLEHTILKGLDESSQQRALETMWLMHQQLATPAKGFFKDQKTLDTSWDVVGKLRRAYAKAGTMLEGARVLAEGSVERATLPDGTYTYLHRRRYGKNETSSRAEALRDWVGNERRLLGTDSLAAISGFLKPRTLKEIDEVLRDGVDTSYKAAIEDARLELKAAQKAKVLAEIADDPTMARPADALDRDQAEIMDKLRTVRRLIGKSSRAHVARVVGGRKGKVVRVGKVGRNKGRKKRVRTFKMVIPEGFSTKETLGRQHVYRSRLRKQLEFNEANGIPLTGLPPKLKKGDPGYLPPGVKLSTLSPAERAIRRKFQADRKELVKVWKKAQSRTVRLQRLWTSQLRTEHTGRVMDAYRNGLQEAMEGGVLVGATWANDAHSRHIRDRHRKLLDLERTLADQLDWVKIPNNASYGPLAPREKVTVKGEDGVEREEYRYRGMWVRKSVFEATMGLEREINSWVQFYDTLHAFAKRNKTARRLPSHFVNAFSNFWLISNNGASPHSKHFWKAQTAAVSALNQAVKTGDFSYDNAGKWVKKIVSKAEFAEMEPILRHFVESGFFHRTAYYEEQRALERSLESIEVEIADAVARGSTADAWAHQARKQVLRAEHQVETNQRAPFRLLKTMGRAYSIADPAQAAALVITLTTGKGSKYGRPLPLDAAMREAATLLDFSQVPIALQRGSKIPVGVMLSFSRILYKLPVGALRSFASPKTGTSKLTKNMPVWADLSARVAHHMAVHMAPFFIAHQMAKQVWGFNDREDGDEEYAEYLEKQGYGSGLRGWFAFPMVWQDKPGFIDLFKYLAPVQVLSWMNDLVKDSAKTMSGSIPVNVLQALPRGNVLASPIAEVMANKDFFGDEFEGAKPWYRLASPLVPGTAEVAFDQVFRNKRQTLPQKALNLAGIRARDVTERDVAYQRYANIPGTEEVKLRVRRVKPGLSPEEARNARAMLRRSRRELRRPNE